MEELVRRFHALFAGLETAHGEYTIDVSQAEEGKKLEGIRGTKPGPASLALWRRHLMAGGFGLGITPARFDGTCRFGAIDVDRYNVDLAELNRKVQELELPLIVCRTKSGGAHLYLFGAEDLSCEIVRAKLWEWAGHLGEQRQPDKNGKLRECEIFPKQDKILNEDDVGSWINLPYQGGDNTTRYAFSADGQQLSAEGFLAYAEDQSVTVSELASIEFVEVEDENVAEADDFFQGPPCLVTLSKEGLTEGNRNNYLFNIGVYLKKRYADKWNTYLQKYSDTYTDPPLPRMDVIATGRSLAKKDYSYKCKDGPISSVCNKEVCATRAFGVQRGASNPGITINRIEKIPTSPPTWVVVINDIRIRMDTADLVTYKLFQNHCINEMNIWPPTLKPGVWYKMIKELLENVVILPAPPDATVDGQLWVQLQRFCTSRVQGKSKDELLLGKPYTDEAAGRTLFCVADFLQYLNQQRITSANEKRIFVWLSERGGVDAHQEEIKGKMIQYWSIPAVSAQKEEFEVPRVEQEAPF